MARIAALGDSAPSECVQDVFREIEPGQCAELGIVSEELVRSIDPQELNARELTHTRGRDTFMQCCFSQESTFVSIAERTGGGLAVCIKADVIYGPAIDCDGANAFRRY